MTLGSSTGKSIKGVKLGGTLSAIVKDSRITKNDLLDVFNSVGIVPTDTYSRQTVVRTGLAAATDQEATDIATTLTHMLRSAGLFASTHADDVARVGKLKAAFASLGGLLSDAGDITWGNGAAQPDQTPTTVQQNSQIVPGIFPGSYVEEQHVGAETAPEPLLTRNRSLSRTVKDIVNLLERLPVASHSLTRKRRKDRPLTDIRDEYDVQDFVFMALRLLYSQVLDEQPSGKKGGDGFNKGDFYLEEHKIMVEAKVAKKGHGVKEIKKEIAVDQAAYRNDASVLALIVVIYDLDYTIADKDALKKFLEEDKKTAVVLVDWFRSAPAHSESAALAAPE